MSKQELLEKIDQLTNAIYDYTDEHDDDSFDDLSSACTDIIETN